MNVASYSILKRLPIFGIPRMKKQEMQLCTNTLMLVTKSFSLLVGISTTLTMVLTGKMKVTSQVSSTTVIPEDLMGQRNRRNSFWEESSLCGENSSMPLILNLFYGKKITHTTYYLSIFVSFLSKTLFQAQRILCSRASLE